jgi:hypothetical protein
VPALIALERSETMVDLYDDNAIDYFEEEDEIDAAEAGFMHGYLSS